MNLDDLESRMQQTPLRPPPAEWRAEILATAQSSVAANVNRRTTPVRELTSAGTWRRRLRELFWPHPVAWGVMAALWVAVGGVHVALREPATGVAPFRMAACSGLPTMLAMQEEILAALNEQQEPPPPAPTRPAPPQSCVEPRRESYDV